MKITMRSLPILTAGLGLAALLALPAPVESTPDLVALFANGPGLTHVNSQKLVVINVANFGDELVGDYTAEIVLSEDNVVDGSDLVVGSIVSDFIGSQAVTVNVPFSAPVGQLHWGLRVLPAANEVVLANNASIGTLTTVVKTDLTILDPAPIEMFWSPTDEAAPTAEVAVDNIGSLSSILIFTAQALSPTPWLDLDPESSFAISGEEGNAITLVAKPEGLALGTYNTTLRFQNINQIDDFIDIEVSLTIGPARFSPGDRVVGHVSTPGDVDLVHVNLLKGEKLKLKTKTKAGLKPTITFVDPDGFVETKMKFKNKNGGFQKKAHKAKKTGTYTLLIEGKGNSIGGYMIKTGRKLPKKALPRKIKFTASSETEQIDLLAHKGALLDFAVDPKGGNTGLTIALSTPLGSLIDLNTAVQLGPGGSVICENLEVDEMGPFLITVGGLNIGDKTKVTVYPVHPQKPFVKIYLP